MKVDIVKIKLLGKYRIERLEELGYKKNNLVWYFDGVQHRYMFVPITDNEVQITIIKKPYGTRALYHEITFPQISSWVKDSVNKIQVGRR